MPPSGRPVCRSVDFCLDYWFMWEGPARCGWCSSRFGGPGLYEKAPWTSAEEQASKFSVVSAVLPALSSRLSCPWWITAVSQINPELPWVAFGHCLSQQQNETRMMLSPCGRHLHEFMNGGCWTTWDFALSRRSPTGCLLPHYAVARNHSRCGPWIPELPVSCSTSQISPTICEL